MGTRASWRGDKRTANDRGYNYKWQVARLHHLRSKPLCCMCEAQGLTVLATVVDHIIPHEGDQSLFWDMDNWQSLCKPHHDSDKALMEHGKAKQTIGTDGWPIA